jgi:hypothetical protein
MEQEFFQVASSTVASANGGEGAFTASLWITAIKMTMAFVLGSIVAFRPWRFPMGLPRPPREMVHAQVLIAVAGALAVIVIGESLAIAFGLVGLGGFIRFRTGIRDPRDAAVFFLIIGIGMACGLGDEAWGAALVCTVFISAILCLLEFQELGKRKSYLRITVMTMDARGSAGAAQAAIESFPVRICASAIKLQAGRLRFDLENPQGVSPSDIVAKILETSGDDVDTIIYEELVSLKGASL